MDDSKALRFLELLFPFGADRPGWQPFIEALSQELGGAFCAVWGEQSAARPLGVSHPQALEQLRAYHEDPDTRYGQLSELDYPIGVVAPTANRLDGGRMVNSVLDLDPDEAPGLLLPLAGNGKLVRAVLIAFPLDGNPVPAEGRALLERLAPWIVHAGRSDRRMRKVRASGSLAQWFIDRMRFGVVILDDNREVVYANAQAAGILEGNSSGAYMARNGATERGSGLSSALARLRAECEAAQRAEDSLPGFEVTEVELDEELDNVFERKLSFAVVMTPAVELEGFEQWMRERFDLTPAEARLAERLVSDRSLNQAADDLGVAVGTVRTRLKSIFSKTSTNRQASLVRLLLSRERDPLR